METLNPDRGEEYDIMNVSQKAERLTDLFFGKIDTGGDKDLIKLLRLFDNWIDTFIYYHYEDIDKTYIKTEIVEDQANLFIDDAEAEIWNILIDKL